MSLVGKEAVEDTRGVVPYFVGYNPGFAVGIAEITTSNGTADVFQFSVVKKDGTVQKDDQGNDRVESVYLSTKDGNPNLKVVNSILVAIGLAPKPAKYIMTQADVELINAAGTRKQPIAIFMYPKKQKGGKNAGKTFTNYNEYGSLGDRLTINPAALIGQVVHMDAPATESDSAGKEQLAADVVYI